MKNTRILLLALFSIGLVLLGFRLNDSNDQTEVPEGAFALVELYTSEGCSSCPPAERNLNEIIAEAEAKGLPIYAMAFHVDYWNYIGWEDPYSKEAYSQRQRSYGKAFNSNRIYTPQMIINGQNEFVGSDRAKSSLAIQEALEQKPRMDLRLERSGNAESASLQVQFELSEKVDQAVVNLVIVEKNLQNYIPKGENRGKTLKHDNVVRVFEQIPIQKNQLEGSARLFIPADVKREDAKLIGFVQSMPGMKVLGLSQIDL